MFISLTLLDCVFEIVFFYNNALFLFDTQLSISREVTCDSLVD